MNTRLYKFVLSIAFIFQVIDINLCYSADNNDVYFIEKSDNILSMNENNKNDVSNKFFKYKSYDIDNSNCINQVMNDIKCEYNNSDSDSDNEIVKLSSFINNITNDKYNDKDQEKYYKYLIQNDCSNSNIEIISNDNIFSNIYETKVPNFELKITDINFNTIINEQNLSLDFTPQINTIVGKYTEEIETTYNKIPDLNDLLNSINYGNTGIFSGVATFGIIEPKTCYDCLCNIFKKATSFISNIFKSNTNTNNYDNNITEVLIYNNIEDNNNYSADINSSCDNKYSMIYDSESNSSKSSSKKRLLSNNYEN